MGRKMKRSKEKKREIPQKKKKQKILQNNDGRLPNEIIRNIILDAMGFYFNKGKIWKTIIVNN